MPAGYAPGRGTAEPATASTSVEPPRVPRRVGRWGGPGRGKRCAPRIGRQGRFRPAMTGRGARLPARAGPATARLPIRPPARLPARPTPRGTAHDAAPLQTPGEPGARQSGSRAEGSVPSPPKVGDALVRLGMAGPPRWLRRRGAARRRLIIVMQQLPIRGQAGVRRHHPAVRAGTRETPVQPAAGRGAGAGARHFGAVPLASSTGPI